MSALEPRSLLRHPAVWMAAFFAALCALEVVFFVVAGSLPDDRLPEEPALEVPGAAGERR